MARDSIFNWKWHTLGDVLIMKFFICLSKNRAEKRDFLQERKITRTISSIISPYGYKIDYFRYYPNVFGNIVLKIKKGDIIETFITDRGEIYYNDKIVAKSGNAFNLQNQLLRVISDIVSKED